MLGQCLDLRLGGAALYRDWYTRQKCQPIHADINIWSCLQVLLGDSPEPWCNGIDNLLVQCPQRIPLVRDNRLRRSLRQHKLTEGLDSETAAADAYTTLSIREHEITHRARTPDGGEPRVIPTANQTLVNEPMQLALREQCVDEVETAEVPDGDGPDVQRFNKPVVLRVTIAVLVCPQSMRYAFEGVDDRAREVVSGVNLPLVSTRFGMRCERRGET